MRPTLVALILVLCGAVFVGAQSSAPFATLPPNTPLSPYQQAVAEYRKRSGAFYARAAFTEAIAACKAGVALAEENENPGDQAAFLWQISYDYWLLGDLPTALEYAQRGLRIDDAFPEDRRRSALLRMMGVVYQSMGDLVRAREYSGQALALAERSKLDRECANALTTLGNIALKQGDIAAARKNFETALGLFKINGTERTQANALVNIANVEEAERNLPKALATQEKVLAMRVVSQDRRGQVNSHRELARVLRALGRLDDALAHIAVALPLAQEIGGHELLATLYAEAVLTHEARGEFAPALKFQRLVTTERDALGGERTRAHAAEIQARYELERNREAISRLTLEKNVQSADLHARELELQRDHAIRLVLYIAIGFILAVVVPLFCYRSRKRV
jgi:tetratricopeptide (TPR) repeat protein